MKILKILLCSLLIVTIVTVPCLATNEGTSTNEGIYGHYVSPGTYMFDEDLSFSNAFILYFDFVSDGQNFNYIRFYSILSFVYSDIVVVYDDGEWLSDDYRIIEVLDGFYIDDSNVYYWWIRNTTRIDASYDSSLFDEFLSMFTFVGQWISGAVEDLTAMFWVDNSLTLVGTLSIASLAMAVSFLIIGLISRFLRFRG